MFQNMLIPSESTPHQVILAERVAQLQYSFRCRPTANARCVHTLLPPCPLLPPETIVMSLAQKRTPSPFRTKQNASPQPSRSWRVLPSDACQGHQRSRLHEAIGRNVAAVGVMVTWIGQSSRRVSARTRPEKCKLPFKYSAAPFIVDSADVRGLSNHTPLRRGIARATARRRSPSGQEDSPATSRSHLCRFRRLIARWNPWDRRSSQPLC